MMKWIDEPTVPGWYWHRNKNDHSVFRAVYVRKETYGLGVYAWGHGGYGSVKDAVGDHLEWLGPIYPED